MNKNLSIYLDLLRFLAALLVVIGHIIRFTPASFLWHLRPLGHQAVIVFFVLSGFVIAYSVEKKDHDLATYVINRLSRLYSVVLPCLIVTPMIYFWTRHADASIFSARAAAPTSVKSMVEHAIFLNQTWFENALYFANGPMWSLSFEFWYYAVFGAAYFFKGRARILTVALCCLIAGPKILLLMPIWLMGVVAYHMTQRGMSTGAGAFVMAASLVTLGIYFGFHLDVKANQLSLALVGPQHITDFHYSRFFVADTVLGLMIAVHFVGISAVSRYVRFGALVPLIRTAASFTFSIYLFHFPLLYLSNALLPQNLPANERTVTIMAIALGGSCLLGLVTEHKKHLYVRFLKSTGARRLPAT